MKIKKLINHLLPIVKDKFKVHPKNTDDILKRELKHYLESTISFEKYENFRKKSEILKSIKNNPMEFLEPHRFIFEWVNVLDE